MGKHWEVQLDVVDLCSKGPKKKVIWLKRLAKLKVDALMNKFKDQEWLAYLIGEDNRVEDLFVPEQMADHSFVGNVKCEEYNSLRIIGVMHSHHNMKMDDFSGHDDDFINSNHNISLLVNLNGPTGYKITGQSRVEVPCGALYIVPVDVKLDLEVEFDKKAFLEEIEQKVNPPKTGCTQTVCYCGKCNLGGRGTRFNTTLGQGQNFPLPPAHARTFPTHSPDCQCTSCISDRNAWRNRLSSRGWNTADFTDFSTEGSWICEECSKLNYESDEDNAEPLESCVWCDSPKNKDEINEEEIDISVEDIIDDINEIINTGIFGAEEEKQKDFMKRKYNDVVADLADEKILDNAIHRVAKYLYLIKRVDEGEYKGKLDLFARTISVDYAENEDNLKEEIESIILELEDKVEEKNIEN